MLKPRKLRRFYNIPHLASLQYPDYRSTWTANMFSGAAMWTSIVAISWLVLERTQSSGWVGIITFTSMIPFLLASPIGGLMADRLDRRNLALATLACGSIVMGILATLTIANVIQLWHIAILVFMGGMLRATQEPTIQSLIPNQVPKEHLLNAITLNATTRHGARFFGLLVSAPLLATDSVSVKGVLVLSTVFYLVATLIMTRTRTVSVGEIDFKHGAIRAVMDGLQFIYSNKTIALFVILVALHCALVMSFESILPIFSKETLSAGDGSVLGYLVMGFGVGALVGTFLLAGVKDDKIKGQLLLWTGIASGLTPIVLSLSGNSIPAIISTIGMGASQSMFMALTNTYVQFLAPDHLRGRIASLYTLHAGGIMAFANLGYGFMADIYSAPPILFVTGALFILLLAGIGSAQPILRRLFSEGQLAEIKI